MCLCIFISHIYDICNTVYKCLIKYFYTMSIRKEFKIVIKNFELLLNLTILFFFTSTGTWLYIKIRKLCSWHWRRCLTRLIYRFTGFSYITISHSRCRCHITSLIIVTTTSAGISTSVSATSVSSATE